MPRIRVQVSGVVQGVGFRPFVYRLAQEHQLTGWVLNRSDGVELEAEGRSRDLEAFLEAIAAQKPAPARIRDLTATAIPDVGEPEFRILPSAASQATRFSVPADLALCAQCARELTTPSDRRHGYAFTHCTYCGPRFTLLESLPYDRSRTSMKAFPMCQACEREYRNPLDRRFHAQPIACPDCGPQLSLSGFTGGSPLLEAARRLLEGQILALKGLGGYQLLVDATCASAVARLRERKHREEKPLAVMFPDLEAVRAVCEVSEDEARLLGSPEAPVLLLGRRTGSRVVEGVAPRNPRLGAFLPTTPLHVLLLQAVGRPLVCTSGNLSEEPMCIEDEEARLRLGSIADHFLIHDRPILRPVDDSVLRLDAHGPTLLRRARGYVPLAHPVSLRCEPVLALGAHQKSTLCLLARGEALVSQHLGDLHSAEAVALLERTVEDFLRFFQVVPALLACDLHPEYASTRLGERLARAWDLPLVRVQHHHAHVAACCAEWGLEGPVLGLAWDGAGLGSDGELWGGEALVVDGAQWRRVGHLASFPLPGGEEAMRTPARSALGLLWESLGPGALKEVEPWFTLAEFRVLATLLERRLHCPRTTSIGRLFDAVAALLGIRGGKGFEGQAAMELEFAAQGSPLTRSYPWHFREGPLLVADPAPLIEALLEDRRRGVPAAEGARCFHVSLADLAVAMARQGGCQRVVLTGGCFQNALLVGLVRRRLEEAGFQPISPRTFPPNDGGVSLGQAVIAGALGPG